jgi:hypothetical protein
VKFGRLPFPFRGRPILTLKLTVKSEKTITGYLFGKRIPGLFAIHLMAAKPFSDSKFLFDNATATTYTDRDISNLL